jgi:hypothetical protein
MQSPLISTRYHEDIRSLSRQDIFEPAESAATLAIDWTNEIFLGFEGRGETEVALVPAFLAPTLGYEGFFAGCVAAVTVFREEWEAIVGCLLVVFGVGFVVVPICHVGEGTDGRGGKEDEMAVSSDFEAGYVGDAANLGTTGVQTVLVWRSLGVSTNNYRLLETIIRRIPFKDH